jgi:hypothetical protein
LVPKTGLVHERRVLDVPLEERLQLLTSELLAWAKTMLPLSTERPQRSPLHNYKLVIKDIRSYFSKATAPVAIMDH